MSTSAKRCTKISGEAKVYGQGCRNEAEIEGEGESETTEAYRATQQGQIYQSHSQIHRGLTFVISVVNARIVSDTADVLRTMVTTPNGVQRGQHFSIEHKPQYLIIPMSSASSSNCFLSNINIGPKQDKVINSDLSGVVGVLTETQHFF